MIDRLKLIMQTKNISPAEFADILEVQRSGISHLLSGRNNPSLGFIEKILLRFPEISPDWLILGKGAMNRTSVIKNKEIAVHESNISSGNKIELDLFDSQPLDELKNDNKYTETFDIIDNDTNFPLNDRNLFVDNNSENKETIVKEETVKDAKILETKINEEHKDVMKSENRCLEKIVFFYSDHSFKEYKPE